MNLEDTEFQHVRLGAVFFDPQTGRQFQKVDQVNMYNENVHGESVNARPTEGNSKNFNHDDIVKAHPNHILN